MHRGLGYLPDRYDPGDDELAGGVFRATFVATPLTSPVVGVRQHAPPTRDQFGTNECVGFTLAGAIYTAFAAEGRKPSEPFSPQFPYSTSRNRHTRPDRRLTDDGTYLRDAILALQDHGICPESSWPFDPYAVEQDESGEVLRVNSRPPLSAVRDAYDLHTLEGKRIVAFGSRVLDEIDLALDDRRPVTIGLMVTTSFLDAGEFVTDLDGASIGGHAMYITERIIRGVDRWYWVQNSWGTSWGVSGGAYLHERVVRRALDLHAIHV